MAADKGGFRHWHFIHPRLAEMILETVGSDKGIGLVDVRIAYLLDGCNHYPYVLMPISNRLAKEQYTKKSEFLRWIRIIKTDQNLIDRTFAINPFWWILEKFNIYTQVDKFKHGQFRSILISNLRRIMLNFLAKFFRFFEKRTGKANARDLLNDVFSQNAYMFTLRRSVPSVLLPLLQYLKERNDKEKASQLIKVLQDDSVLPTLRQSIPLFLSKLLKCVNTIDKDRARKLLIAILEDDSYLPILRRYRPDALADFIHDIEEIDENRAHNLLIAILEEYLPILRRYTPNALGTFLYNLSTQYNNILAQNLLDKIFGGLSIEEFEKKISVWPRGQIIGLRNKIREANLQLSHELWESLIKISVGKKYQPLRPDTEYPQEKLFGFSVSELRVLLKHFRDIDKRHKMNCIIKSLISNESKLINWFEKTNRDDATILRDTIQEINVRIPEKPWEILLSRCEDNNNST